MHAETAAHTWSNWGLQVASYACEALAEWGPSERWIREASMSYPTSSGHHWYFWCRRTGRGDEGEARLLAEKFYSANILQPTRNEQISLGAYRLLEGDVRGALDAYRKAQSLAPSFGCSFMISQLARQLSDGKMSKRVLQEMEMTAEKNKKSYESFESIKPAGLEVLELIKSGEASVERLKRIDNLLAEIGDGSCSAFAYFVGKELHGLGKSDEAERYWRRALALAYQDPLYATLAGNSLAKIHGTSRPDNDRLGKDDVWPPRKGEGLPE